MKAVLPQRGLKAAFSLVEVLCALLILGLGLAGLTQGITTALSASKDSELQTTAAFLAMGRLEFIRADGFLAAGTKEGKCEPPMALYRWRETVAEAGVEGLFEVSVTIESAATGKPVCELTTLLFDPPYVPPAETTERDGERKKGDQESRRDRERRTR